MLIGLSGHVREGVEAILWPQHDFVDGNVVRPLALFVEHTGRIEVAVGWGIQLGGVALQGMGAELFDIHRHRGCQALGRSASNRIGLPSGLVRRGSPCFSRALLLVTSGSLFWIVAVGPENTAIFGFVEIDFSVILCPRSQHIPSPWTSNRLPLF